jgi:hypothetical protein
MAVLSLWWWSLAFFVTANPARDVAYWYIDIAAWRLVGIDSALLGSGHADAHRQTVFMESSLRGRAGRPVTLFQHVPPFDKNPEDAELTFEPPLMITHDIGRWNTEYGSAANPLSALQAVNQRDPAIPHRGCCRGAGRRLRTSVQIVFLTGATTVLYSSLNQTGDVGLAILLIVGGVIGVQFGAVAGGASRANSCASCWPHSY